MSKGIEILSFSSFPKITYKQLKGVAIPFCELGKHWVSEHSRTAANDRTQYTSVTFIKARKKRLYDIGV
jgi:hypothetical protein